MSNDRKGAASAAPNLPELAKQIRAEIKAAEQGHRAALEHAIKAGELLTQAKAQMGHGEWLPWLEKNFPGARTSAASYMRLAHPANVQRVAHLGSVREALAAIREPRKETKPPRERKRDANTSPAQAIERLRQRVREVRSKNARVRPRWTLEDTDDVNALITAKRQPNRSGKRLHQIGNKRAAARRAGDPIVLWDAAYDITKLCGLLQSLQLDDIELDEHTNDTLNDLHDDMLYLQDWMDTTVFAVQARLGEGDLRRKITALRAKTIANGCTAEEEALAQRAATRLERRLGAQLAS